MKDDTPKKDSSTRDSYIVRIYRRNRNNRKKITGIVETIHLGKEDAFKSAEELMAILTRPITGIPAIRCRKKHE